MLSGVLWSSLNPHEDPHKMLLPLPAYGWYNQGSEREVNVTSTRQTFKTIKAREVIYEQKGRRYAIHVSSLPCLPQYLTGTQPSTYFHDFWMLVSQPSWVLSQTRARSVQEAGSSSEPLSILLEQRTYPIWSYVRPPPKSNVMGIKQARPWVKLSRRWGQ